MLYILGYSSFRRCHVGHGQRVNSVDANVVVGNMAMLIELETWDRGGAGVALGVLGYIGMLGTATIQPKAFRSKKEGVGCTMDAGL